jgi:hypothetical protein
MSCKLAVEFFSKLLCVRGGIIKPLEIFAVHHPVALDVHDPSIGWLVVADALYSAGIVMWLPSVLDVAGVVALAQISCAIVCPVAIDVVAARVRPAAMHQRKSNSMRIKQMPIKPHPQISLRALAGYDVAGARV